MATSKPREETNSEAPAFEPLHLKYRPKKFEDVLGNVLALRALQSALSRPAKPRCYLFIGPSGCGKTTLARIVRTKLGCSDVDYNEMNGANYRGIDDVRKLIVNAKFRPISGKIKVYLLDECHQLTKDAQNALLKTLEEGPSFCYWLLATTDPDKLIGTIKTRSVVIEVQTLSVNRTEELLRRVCEGEGHKVPDKTLNEIAYVSNGSARQALMVLDQIIDIEDPDEQFDSVQEMTGSEFQVIQLCRALVAGDDWAAIRSMLIGIQQEPEATRRQIGGYMNAIILNPKSNIKVERIAEMSQFFLESVMYSGQLGLTLACYAASGIRD